jgi:predicted RNA-binding Zn-ribbon protein involved in translation (DUF1610 family)
MASLTGSSILTDTIPGPQTTSSEANVRADDMMCLACGYNLRGLSGDGNCPECGHSIQRTIVARQGMTKRELAALAFRITALWMLLATIINHAQIWQYYLRQWTQSIVMILMLGLVCALLGLLWWKSDVLAKKAIVTDGPLSLDGRIVSEQIMAAAFGIIGVQYLIYGIVGSGWAAVELGLTQQNNPYPMESWIAAAINLLIGGVMLISASRIAGLVIWLRTAGTRSDK